MILVDTSIWIDFFKNSETRYSLLLDELLEEREVATINIIKAEIIPSAHNDKEFDILKDYFGALHNLPEPPDVWDLVISHQYRLKKKGVYKIALTDVLIATYALFYKIPLFTKDNDFRNIARVFPLELFRVG